MSIGPGRHWVRNTARLVLLLVLAPHIVGIQAGPARAASGTCYLIGGSVAWDLSVTDLGDVNSATNETTIGGANLSLLTTAAVQPGTGWIFSVKNSKLGTIDPGTGIFSELGSVFGSQPGSAGNQNLNQVTGLAFDPADGTLFAVARRIGGPDVLFKANPSTGVAIPNAFGLGVGYVEIISNDPSEVTFIGIALAADGQMVGMGSDGTGQWKLHTINKMTGAALAVLSSSAVTDLSYDSTGTLWGVAASGTLFDVNGVEPSRSVDNLVPYSALACPSVASNQTPTFGQNLEDRSDPEGSAISLSAGATDGDLGDILLFSAVGLPAGLTIAPDTGLITGTVGAGAAASSPYSVTVTVTDDGTPIASATDVFSWTVTEVNQTPAFGQDLPDRSDPEGTVVSTSAGATDPDTGQTLDYSALNLPPGLSINSTSGLISGTITYVASGSYAITVTVTDDGTPVASATDTFTWTVTNTNQTPIFNQNLPNRSDPEGTVISLSAAATDPDVGDVLGYLATGLPPGLTINPTTGLITGTIANTASGPHFVTISAIDHLVPLSWAADTFTWTVSEVNQTPIFGQDLPDRSDAEGTAISLSAGATDPDPTDTLTYSAAGLPPGLVLDTGSGLITGTITYTATGTYPVTITVTDDGTPVASATDTFTWTVTEVNQTPIFGQDLLDRSHPEGAVISLSAAATDPDVGDTLLYSATGLPPGLMVNPTSGAITGTITYTATGTYPVTFTVTDNGTPVASATDTFTWTISEQNQTPIFGQDLPNRWDPEGTIISISAGASDPDPADTLTYAATGLPPGLTINPTTGTITGTITYTATGTYPVTITVTDDGTPVASATDTFTWTISEQNQTPAFNQNLPNRSDANGAAISLPAGANDPDVGDTLTFTAAGLPPGLAINPASGLITGTITYTANGAYPVTITVTDDGTPNASAIDLFTWTVNWTNTAQTPVIRNQDPIAISDDFSGLDTSPISIDVLANDSDPDADELTLVSFDDSTITHGDLVDLGDGRFSYTPQTGNSYTEFFTYTITDGWGGFATTTATITVTAAQVSTAPPIVDPTPPAADDDGEPPQAAIDIPSADQTVPGVIGGQESAQRKGSLVAELADFQSDSTVVVAERGPVRRTLVVLGRVSLDTFETMGPSLALLVGLLVLVVAFGRIGLFPFLKRTRRLRGVVVWLDRESGYGFILPDQHQAEVFFHQVTVGQGGEVPAPGDQVSYRMVRGGRRDFAFGVRSVQAT